MKQYIEPKYLRHYQEKLDVQYEELKGKVIKIFDMRNTGYSYREISNETDESISIVIKILTNQGSKEVKEIIKENNLKVAETIDVELKNLVQRIFELKNSGHTYEQIESMTNKDASFIYRVLNNQGNKNVKKIIKNNKLFVNSNIEKQKRISKPRQPRSYIYSPEEEQKVIDMFKMRNEGYTLQKVADKYDVTRESVRQTLSGIVKRDIIKKYNLKINK